MAYELRPYQQDALDAVLEQIKTDQFVLLRAATGAGKTILFSALIKYCMTEYKMRIGIVAHREQLVRQAYDKLLKVWPEGKSSIGIACASVSNKMNLEKPVIIGSPQTLTNHLGEMPPLQMLIVDECHRIPPRSTDSQYSKLIYKLLEYYPKLRLLGVTATPYRLVHGFIYGKNCRPDEPNWFDKECYGISIKTLQDEGFLVPLVTWQPKDKLDLSDVKVSSTGEYVLGDLSDEMSKEIHLRSAVSAVQKYASDRKHIVVFGVTIEHIELLKEWFEKAGYKAECVHSDMPHGERMQHLKDFDDGKLDVICNVGVLTEGWDCTSVDCMVMCRPTKSTALYVQMIGRGLRTHEGKKDCLLLDLSGNKEMHGDPNKPKIRYKHNRAEQVIDEDDYDEEGNVKDPPMCPKCGRDLRMLNKYGKVKNHRIQCPHCNTYLVTVNNNGIEMYCEDKERQKQDEQIFGLKEAEICSVHIDEYTSRKGNEMIRVTMQCLPRGHTIPVRVQQFWDIEGQGSLWGMNRARQSWMELTTKKDELPPETLTEAMDRLEAEELEFPQTCWIELQGKYFNVKKWGANG